MELNLFCAQSPVVNADLVNKATENSPLLIYQVYIIFQ